MSKFKARAFITGFTGSAGTAVITKDEAGLWTDGRYFIQAAQQLEGSGVKLFKMGEPGVPTVEEYIANVIPENGTLGFDGRVVAMGEGQALVEAVAPKHAKINYSEDLIDLIWKDRPALSEKPAFALGEEYTGESTASKLARIREAMKEHGATVHVIAALDDVCWTTNLRGDDIEYFNLSNVFLKPVHETSDCNTIFNVCVDDIFDLYVIFHCLHKNGRVHRFYNLRLFWKIVVKSIVKTCRVYENNIRGRLKSPRSALLKN